MEKGFLYETHMHTAPASACATATPAQQVRAYKDRGYAGIIITEHFTNGNSGCPLGLTWGEKMAFVTRSYEEAKVEGGKRGLDVFFGIEFNIGDLEFLTYGISPALLYENPGLDRLGVKEYSEFVRRSGGYLAQAHPFRTAPWIVKSEPVDPALIDGMEVFNAGDMGSEANLKAQKFARRHGIPMQAGTDSHHKKIPVFSGVGLKTRAESVFDIIAAIKAHEVTLIMPP